MKREQLVDKLEKAWEGFQDSYAGLSETQMLQPGVTGDWSVKDILAHVTWWEEEALKHLPNILKGARRPRYSVTYGGIDAFNAQMTGLRRDLSLDAVLAQMLATHTRLLEFIDGVPEEHFTREGPFRHGLRLDTYSHYPEHERAIRAWRQQQGFTAQS